MRAVSRYAIALAVGLCATLTVRSCVQGQRTGSTRIYLARCNLAMGVAVPASCVKTVVVPAALMGQRELRGYLRGDEVALIGGVKLVRGLRSGELLRGDHFDPGDRPPIAKGEVLVTVVADPDRSPSGVTVGATVDVLARGGRVPGERLASAVRVIAVDTARRGALRVTVQVPLREAGPLLAGPGPMVLILREVAL